VGSLHRLDLSAELQSAGDFNAAELIEFETEISSELRATENSTQLALFRGEKGGFLGSFPMGFLGAQRHPKATCILDVVVTFSSKKKTPLPPSISIRLSITRRLIQIFTTFSPSPTFLFFTHFFMLAGILLWIVKYVQKCVWGDYNNFLNGQA